MFGVRTSRIQAMKATRERVWKSGSKKTRRQNGISRFVSASLGLGEAVIVSVTHSNTECHDNRLTGDWSGCCALVTDLSTV